MTRAIGTLSTLGRKIGWKVAGTISTKANTASQSSILSSNHWFEDMRHTTASCCYHQQIVPISVSVKKRWKNKESICHFVVVVVVLFIVIFKMIICLVVVVLFIVRINLLFCHFSCHCCLIHCLIQYDCC